MRDVEIRDDMIRLGQLLKLAGLVEDGAEAKEVLEEGLVEVNGAVETRRGKQIVDGDEVVLCPEIIRVVTAG
ncbi:RNA-binding S4 domain-containing protein [Saccharopolyspora sp. WRP15-2]|uniref:RNA-binding S4 domain-containing protein n=1 Tax=Saccharopolyspora oryzae TaxID=2997343 RepID=A0ABT4UYR9_9PSEU|nr:RNA-binding S4 domain-containing protein [Saccharopolyspora oryzae]MDA3626848.1 RNA-binding S4 domain-containing protein [Saccharopolyspora oryzae]